MVLLIRASIIFILSASVMLLSVDDATAATVRVQQQQQQQHFRPIDDEEGEAEPQVHVPPSPPPPPPPKPAPPPTDNDLLLNLRTPDRIATLEAACLQGTKRLAAWMIEGFRNLVNATLVEFHVIYVPQALWSPDLPWRCGPHRRDELERVTRMLCKPPHSFYVTCDPSVVTNGKATTLMPVRIAVRSPLNSQPCDCEAPPWDEEEGIPGHAAALAEAAARIKEEATRVPPPQKKDGGGSTSSPT